MPGVELPTTDDNAAAQPPFVLHGVVRNLETRNRQIVVFFKKQIIDFYRYFIFNCIIFFTCQF